MKKIFIILAFAIASLTSTSQVKYYITDASGQPWGSSSNINDMNTAFGAGNWIQAYFQTVNVNALFQSSVCLIYCDGGSMAAAPMNAFVVANQAAINNWVFAGGRLFMNVAANTGGNINYGFGGVVYNYATGPYSSPGAAVNNAHPIYVGPAAISSFTHQDNYYDHGYVTGPGLTPIINNTYTPWSNGVPGAGYMILGSLPWGSGMALFGSMTNTSFHNPAPSAGNLRANMLSWLAVCCLVPTITAVASPTSVCAGSPSTLSASGAGAGGTYTWNPGAIGGSMVVVSPTVTTTYTVSGTTSLGCTGTRTVQIVVNPSPTVTAIISPSAICIGQSATVTLNGASSYTTNAGNLVGSPIVLSPTVTTIYTTAATSSLGCAGSGTFQIIVNPLPVVVPGSNSPLCAGASLSLTVGAATSYTWAGPNAFASNVQNPVIPNVNVGMSGIYTVSSTNASGCTGTGTVNVIVNPPAVVTPTNSGPYCAGTTISLSVGAATSYSWTGPNAFVNNTQNPTINNCQAINGGVYTVSVVIGGCMGTGTTNVVIIPSPSPTATSNSPVCVNQPINFTGSGGTTYTWTGPGGFVSNLQNPVIALASATNAGTYTLSVSANGFACVNSTTTNVVVNPLPVVTAGGSTVCLNTTINLTSGGANTYAWSGPNAYSSLAQNPSILFAAMSMNGQYTVTGTSALGCTNTAVANVLVLALPSPTITSNSAVCVGSALNFTASGGATYIWTGPNGFASASANPTIPNTSMAANGTYSLIATAGSCSAATSAVIVVNPLPTPTITSNSPVCLFQSISFFAGGGSSYAWAGPNGFTGSGGNLNIPSANNVNAGTYTLTVTDVNNCVNTMTSAVSINPLPVIAAVGSTVCATTTINLSASGGTAYSWVGPNGFSSAASQPFITNADLSQQGDYTVTATDINGCVSSSVTNVKINPIPTPTVSANTPICANQTISLNSGALNAVSYIWNGPNGFSSIKQNPMINDATPITSGVYTVTVTDNIGCSGQAMVSMIVNELPVVSITSNIKGGCVPVCITFSPQSTTSIQSCYWKFGDGSSAGGLAVQKCYTSAGSFGISSKFTDINGCSNTGTFSVETYPIPHADFNYASAKPIINETVEFTDASSGANVTSWIWNFSHLKNQVSLKPETSLAYENPGTYVVALIVMSDHGCRDTAVRSITIGDDFGVYVPNAFSPNGDGLNDIFQPKGFGIVKYELNIFDRWGERMFTTSDFEKGWDGIFSGRGGDMVKEDVYTWKIRLVTISGKSKELSGKLTLIK